MRLAPFLLLSLFAIGCTVDPSGGPSRSAVHPTYAIALHGGAGTMEPGSPKAEQDRYRQSLAAALRIGQQELASGGTSLDACEKVIRYLEDDDKFNAGKGAVYNALGHHELDAAIMDGRTLGCGAVAGVTTVRNPIRLARAVMERSPHVLLMGAGAEQFADGRPEIERVPNGYFDTPDRYEQLQKKLAQQSATSSTDTPKPYRGTVGCVALDTHGNLAAATSTGGLTAKRFGRVGDSPIIGAGTYANNRSAAISCTGTGEEFIRHTVARDIAALHEYKGLSLNAAAHEVVDHKLAPDDGGIIAVSRTGEIAMVTNTAGMYRAAADSTGRFEVHIFTDEK